MPRPRLLAIGALAAIGLLVGQAAPASAGTHPVDVADGALHLFDVNDDPVETIPLGPIAYGCNPPPSTMTTSGSTSGTITVAAGAERHLADDLWMVLSVDLVGTYSGSAFVASGTVTIELVETVLPISCVPVPGTECLIEASNVAVTGVSYGAGVGGLGPVDGVVIDGGDQTFETAAYGVGCGAFAAANDGRLEVDGLDLVVV